jgi:two-component system nitrogen regulation response regulator GlnG
MPPLRERPEDIPQIVDFVLQTLQKQKKTRVKKVTTEAMAVLRRHKWPGNVRELENVIYRSAVIAQGDAILVKNLPAELRGPAGAAGTPPAPVETSTEAPVETAEPETMPAAKPAAPALPIPALSVPGPSLLTLQDALDFVYARLKAEGTEPVLERLEREMIRRVLKDEHGNLVRASERLGMTRTTLRKRIDALGLKV